MAMQDKTVYQKMYERWQMAKRLPLSVMVARGPDGGEALYLVAESDDGAYPLARLISHAELEETKPASVKSSVVQTFFEAMEIIDPRDDDSTIDDWCELVGFGFEEAFKKAVSDLLFVEDDSNN